jgi:iron complex outermembrane receptor protein
MNKPHQLLSMILLALAANTVNASDTALTLGTLEVSAKQSGTLKSEQVLTSVDILDSSMIANQNSENTWQLFSLLPGTNITNYNQGAISGEFSIRGFNAEGQINAVKLLIDGIPSNTNSGNMEYIDMVSSLDIESIELVRGTNDPRYGLHNIAGNANISTRIGGDYTTVKASAGSFDTYNFQVASGLEGEQFSQNYALSYQESGGYRDNSDYEKVSLAGKWFFTPDNGRYSVGLIARWHESNAESPGYLLANDARNHPSMSYAFNHDDRSDYDMGQLSAHLDVDVTDKLFWSFKTYVNSFEKDRLLQWISTSSKQQRIEDEVHYGAISTLTYRMNDTLTLEGGLDIQHQENESIRRLSGLRDQQFDITTYGAFAQGIVQPTSWLKLVPALRVDTIKGDFENRLTNTKESIHDYDAIWQPKFSAVVTPIEGYNLYANWGRTFQIGVGAGAYHADSDPALSPSINDGWELGLKFTPIDSVEGRLAYWEQTASDEIRRKFDGTGDGENIGKTRRRGIDVQASWRVIEPLTLWAAYSWQQATVEKPGTNPSDAGTKGKDIDHTPSYLISAGASYQLTPKLTTSLNAYAQGSYYLEKTNSQGKIDNYYLLDMSVDYQLNQQTSLNLQLKNLTNQYSEYAWYWGGSVGSLHTPGDKRAIYGSVSYTFD